MFFNTKKNIKRKQKKNRKHNLSEEPSMFNMISLAILATFAPTRIFLRMHKKTY